MQCTQHAQAQKNTSRSIKTTSLNHYFSGFWLENLNLIEDTWQTQHKMRRTQRTILCKKFFGQKTRQGQKDQTQTNADKKVCVSKLETKLKM